MSAAGSKKLYDLMPMTSHAVLREVEHTLGLALSSLDYSCIREPFELARKLYSGDFPNYRACNTQYHDFQHSIETFLAMARLIHGASVEGNVFSERMVFLGMVSALFHDAGYIQEIGDTTGTGGKYTAVHVQRSMDFVSRHRRRIGITREEAQYCRIMILCTDLNADFQHIRFPSDDVEILGKMLGSADMLAQMADRKHFEKLFYLYDEFSEGQVPGYDSPYDLLRKTVGFYDLIHDRFTSKLSNTHIFMQPHFVDRWNIDRDLYMQSINNARRYLENIVQSPDTQMRHNLRREGIVARASGAA